MTREASAKYYKKNKEKIQKASEKYQNLTEKKNPQKREYGLEPYKNLSENEKQKLVEYTKRY